MSSGPETISKKLRGMQELAEVLAEERAAGRHIVWTNGCFEILHAGHIEFLLKAARLGQVLVVGVNSDASVAALKGAGHPLASLEERVLVLGALACVDYLTVFDDLTSTRALELLKPDVYAKGLKHLHGGINEDERTVMEASGGTIALIGGDPLKSTRGIIDRVRSSAAKHP